MFLNNWWMWNLEMRLVHELLLITRELAAEGAEDKQAKESKERWQDVHILLKCDT